MLSGLPIGDWELHVEGAEVAGTATFLGAGLQQSFSTSGSVLVQTLRLEKPSGADAENIESAIDLEVWGAEDLRPVAVDAGRAVAFVSADGVEAVRYTPLEAVDASGKEAAIHLSHLDPLDHPGSLDSDNHDASPRDSRTMHLHLVVDTTPASYPLQITILITPSGTPKREREEDDNSAGRPSPAWANSGTLEIADTRDTPGSLGPWTSEGETPRAEHVLAAPANDTCAGAVPIPNGFFPVLTSSVDVIDATTTGDPAFCTTEDRTIWYSFTAPSDGDYIITTCAASGALGTSLPDTVLAIYSAAGGCGAPGAPIACNDDDVTCTSGSPAGRQSTLSVSLAAGVGYYIVTGRYAGAAPPAAGQTSIQIRISRAVPPTNDTCAGDVPNLELEIPETGTTQLAGDDYHLSTTGTSCFGLPVSPAPLGNASATTAPGRDVVYAFQAPTAGRYSFRVKGYSVAQNPVLYLSTSCPAPPSVLASPPCLGAANRNVSGGAEEVMCVSMSAGQSVFVFVDDAGASNPGSFFTLEVDRCVRETEPNGTTSSPNMLSCPIEGSINVMNDVDMFTLGTHAAGSRVFAISDGVASSNGDQVLRVTTSTDTLEFEDDDNDTPFNSLSPNLAGTPLTAFTTYLRMSPASAAAAPSEPYRLYALVQTPSASATPEHEPNGSLGNANSGTNNYFAGSLPGPSPSIDVDLYRFRAVAGTLVTLGLDADPLRDNTPINPALALLNASGDALVTVNSLASTSSTASGAGSLTALTPFSPAEGLVYRVPTTDIYYARITIGTTSAGTNGVGDYLLSIGLDCQAGDGDGDGVADALDCAPSNAALWRAPRAVRNLLLDGAATTNLAWQAPSEPGTSAGLRYDLLRSRSASDFSAASAICLETDDINTKAVDSTPRPVLGTGYFYLVRVRNGCGANMGTSSSGVPRSGRTCP